MWGRDYTHVIKLDHGWHGFTDAIENTACPLKVIYWTLQVNGFNI